MSWNNGYETTKFKNAQEKRAREYRAAGMSEDDIQTVLDIYQAEFNGDRTYKTRTVSLQEFNLDDATSDDTENSLMFHNLAALSVTDELSSYHSCFWWIEEITDQRLVARIRELAPRDLLMLTKKVYEQASQAEIASCCGLSQQEVSKRLKKILIFLSKMA